MSTSPYLGYEVDVDEYQPASRPAPITRPGSSARRYQTTDYRPAARPAGAMLTRRATRDQAPDTHQQPDAHLSPRPAPRSQQPEAQKIKRQPTRPHYPQPEPKPEQRQPRIKLHPAVWAGGGMCLLLLALVLSVNVYAWWMNAVSDPGYYTQSAHRDVVSVHQQSGHTEQVRAFVDGQGHLDALIIPDGNMSKSHILQGPVLSGFSNPQQAMLAATAKGDVVDIVAVGPYETSGLTISRPQGSWSVSVTSASKSEK